MTLARIVALALATLSVAAHAGPRLEMRGQVFAETMSSDAQGKIHRELHPAGKVLTGDTLVYVITYRNVGNAASDNVSVYVSIPDEVDYVAGWAEGSDAKPEVSIDRGANFGPLDALSETNADGSKRALLPQDVTNLRWEMPLVVAPGGEGKVLYRARVKARRSYDILQPIFGKPG